jgi:MFS family permease
LEITAKDWQLWSAAKAFTGMGIGFAQTQCVIYVSELSPTQIRGFLLATYALGFALGQLMASIGLQVLAEVSALSHCVVVVIESS